MPLDENEPAAEPSLSDLVAFFTGKDVNQVSGDGEWMTNCPIGTHEDKNPSFSINDIKGRTGVYHCFGCGEHGSGFKFAREVLGKKSWEDAVNEFQSAIVRHGARGPANTNQLETMNAASSSAPGPNVARPPNINTATSTRVARNLRNRSHPTLQPSKPTDDLYDIWRRIDLGDVVTKAARLCQNSLSRQTLINVKPRSYLAERGFWPPDPNFKVGYLNTYSLSPILSSFDNDMLIDAGIAKIGKNNQLYYPLEGRIVFPWCDEYGQVRGLTGRWIGEERPQRTPKYINSRNTDIFQKSKLLWGLHLAKDAITKTGQLLIVEGYTDVMALHKANIKQVVSPIGISISRTQLEKSFSLNNNPLVCLDGDKAGQKASVDVAKRTLEYLREIGPERARGKSLSFALMPGGKDPDEIIREGGAAAFREAIANPLSLERMIEHGEALKRQASEDQARRGGVEGGDGTLNQDAEGSRRTSMKRSAPVADEGLQPSRQLRRLSPVLGDRPRDRAARAR